MTGAVEIVVISCVATVGIILIIGFCIAGIYEHRLQRQRLEQIFEQNRLQGTNPTTHRH